MKLRALTLSIVAAAAMACASPDSTSRALTPDELRTRGLSQQTHGLSTSKDDVIGRFSAHVTQRIEGVAAPIEYMRKACPEKVLNASTSALYGLESPYPIKMLALKPTSIADAPIKTVTDAADAAYTGDFVVVALGGMTLSVFPKGVATLDDKKTPAAKVLRQVTAVAAATPWRQADASGREWTGVRLTASAHTPAAVAPTVFDLLKTWAEDPCQ